MTLRALQPQNCSRSTTLGPQVSALEVHPRLPQSPTLPHANLPIRNNPQPQSRTGSSGTDTRGFASAETFFFFFFTQTWLRAERSGLVERRSRATAAAPRPKFSSASAKLTSVCSYCSARRSWPCPAMLQPSAAPRSALLCLDVRGNPAAKRARVRAD